MVVWRVLNHYSAQGSVFTCSCVTSLEQMQTLFSVVLPFPLSVQCPGSSKQGWPIEGLFDKGTNCGSTEDIRTP